MLLREGLEILLLVRILLMYAQENACYWGSNCIIMEIKVNTCSAFQLMVTLRLSFIPQFVTHNLVNEYLQ
jgi:hypothetical protein